MGQQTISHYMHASDHGAGGKDDADDGEADGDEADADEAGADADEAHTDEADADEVDADEADADEADADEADAGKAESDTDKSGIKDDALERQSNYSQWWWEGISEVLMMPQLHFKPSRAC